MSGVSKMNKESILKNLNEIKELVNDDKKFKYKNIVNFNCENIKKELEAIKNTDVIDNYTSLKNDNANFNEALEAFGRITLHTEYDNDSHYDGLHFEDDCKLVDKALEFLEAIENANPSEALECLECLYCEPEDYRSNDKAKDYETIKNYILKTQESKQCL